MKINGIHHVAIIASDYERSKDFYVNKLGFSIIAETFRRKRNSHKLDLQIGSTDRIELFSFPSPPKRVTNPEACGFRHFALEVDSVEKTAKELKSTGIIVEPIRISIDGKKFTFFQDPDGLPIEIYEK